MGMADAIVRLFQRKTGGSIDLSMTEWEALRVTQHEEPGQEEARAGYRYTFGPKNGITGIAPGVTLTQPAAPFWYPIAEGTGTNTAILSVAAMNRQVNGRWIIPPKKGLALCVTSPAGTTPLYAPVGMHIEKYVTNE